MEGCILQDFKNLKVWKKSHEFTVKIYKVSKQFPNEELFGLTSQIRRACTSIPSNIAEGCGRNSDADFARFLQMAFGSSNELEYQIMLPYDLKYIKSKTYDEIIGELSYIKKMLNKLIIKLKANSQ